MEKLLNLLNEYECYRNGYDICTWWQERDGRIVWVTDDPRPQVRSEYYILSKEYWFIQWLVENDKISNDWIKPRTDLVKEITIVDYKTGDAIWWKNKYTEVEQLIMYLSIQDEPIRFLCEIIK